MLLPFVLLVYRPRSLSWLERPLLMRIGVISYGIYLVHEDLGVLLISRFGGFLGRWSPFSVPLAFGLIALLAELGYRFAEQPVSRFVKRRLWKSGSDVKTASSVPPAS